MTPESHPEGHRPDPLDEWGENAPAFLAAIVASSDDAIVSKTLEGVISSWNRGAERVFGFSAAEAIGQHITLIIPAERWPEEHEVLSRIRSGQRVEHFETVRRRKTGEFITVSLTVSPIRDASGRIVGASKIARDITEQKRAAETVARLQADLLAAEQRARTEAESASQAMDEFLAMLAHELRNPVSVIVNAVAVLEQIGHHEGTRARLLIRRQADHVTRLLDDLLDVARIKRGLVSLKREPLDVRTSIELALEDQRRGIETKRQRLHVSLPDRPLMMIGDPGRLLQVVGNLLNNAHKYTPAEGSIWVSAVADGDQAVVRVRDNGAGIPPDRLDAVFDLFTQVGPTLARTEGGLGIGLALVKRLLELHGGTIHAHSEGPAMGAEFVVRLPLSSDTQEPAPPASRAPASIRPTRIVVIEDNDDAREALILALQLAGHEVSSASSGREGVELVLRERPDLVLIDIGLPDVDGLEVCRQLREKLGSAVRVVALSGYGQPLDRERSLEAGFDAHLVKPVAAPDILPILSQPTS
jgi:two-component system, chemotaxis family, CheB/CheR fusion protein